VALDLGMSIATVSRAMAQPELLSAETRARVLEAIERLGYQPNLIARDLRRQKSGMAYVVVPSLSPFFLEAFRGVERAARETGYAVLMGHTERDPAREQLFLDQVASRRADGIILVTSSSATEMTARKRAIPMIVAALDVVEGVSFPTVRVDHIKASIEATEHLISLGHRRIAHIAGPPRSPMAVHRREGYEIAMRRAGLDPYAYPLLDGDFTVQFGEWAMESLLAVSPRLTAVFASNDELAVGAIQAVKRAGLTVGKDVSVIGYDDQRIASLYEPALTTIRVPTEELGYRSMHILVQVLLGQPHENDLVLPTWLVVRKTTGPAPAD
jgi:LacI family repressor for deo operon, udp, cdd, tsx, nupC, and nupG